MQHISHRLCVLEPGKNRIFTCSETGQDVEIIRDDLTSFPDGIFIDKAEAKIYFTQMGEYDDAKGTAYGDDGSIWSMGLDGSELRCLIEPGKTRTPKQITADLDAGKLYWCDREGLRIMRCNLDGSHLETLVETGKVPEDETNKSLWCVGIALDLSKRQIYWTQKGASDAGEGRICRAGLDIPDGQRADNRQDIEVLFCDLPEPIDLELDSARNSLFWTDRGDLPGGNSVCRATLHEDGSVSHDHRVIVEGTRETIGVAFDHDADLMFITSITGDLYKAPLSGGKPEKIGAFDQMTGIALM